MGRGAHIYLITLNYILAMHNIYGYPLIHIPHHQPTWETVGHIYVSVIAQQNVNFKPYDIRHRAKLDTIMQYMDVLRPKSDIKSKYINIKTCQLRTLHTEDIGYEFILYSETDKTTRRERYSIREQTPSGVSFVAQTYR